MTLFQTSITPSLPPGVYAVSNPPPATIAPTGTGHSVIVGQFPWGPSNSYQSPAGMQAFWQTFAPAGMTRTGSAHLSTIRKGWPQLSGVRVADPSAVAASVVISSSTPTALFTVNALYTGTSGNSIIITIGASGDGVSGHFSLTATVSSASGSTSEFYDNNNVTGTGTQVLPNTTGSALLGAVTFTATGMPVAGNSTMASGTNGTVTSAMYVGTPGGNDKGFALLEGDGTIDGVFTDDCSSGFRSVVNAGLNAHGILTTDRICYIAGNSGQSAASAQTDVASYRSINSVYVDPWANVSDDTDGTIRLVPASCWAASVAAQIPPSLAISWRQNSTLLAGISSLETNRTTSRAQNIAAGICTLIPGPANIGGFTFDHGVNTSLTAGQQDLTRTRMGIYIARSAVNSWYPFIDAPNISSFQQDLINSANNFLSQLQFNASVNAAVLPYIVNFFILPTSASNTPASIAGGAFNVAAQIQTGASMARISLSMSYGPTVTVSTT